MPLKMKYEIIKRLSYSDKMSVPTGDQNITLIITQLHATTLVTFNYCHLQ